VWAVLGTLRTDLLRPPVNEGPHRYVWVTEFPLFDGLDDTGRPLAAHHPFTMPVPEDLELLGTSPLEVRAEAYDLVLNGWELGSGSIRIHSSDVQRDVFRTMGMSDEEARDKFEFLLDALAMGAPPHGGFAMGIERFLALMADEPNIRQVVAFPKVSSGSDPLTGAPATAPNEQLHELGIRLVDESPV
jgi:aspartyl-tRNA synthetase